MNQADPHDPGEGQPDDFPITLEEAGKEFNRDPATLRKAINEGRLFGKKFGTTWTTTRRAMRQYVSRQDPRTKPRKRRKGGA